MRILSCLLFLCCGLQIQSCAPTIDDVDRKSTVILEVVYVVDGWYHSSSVEYVISDTAIRAQTHSGDIVVDTVDSDADSFVMAALCGIDVDTVRSIYTDREDSWVTEAGQISHGTEYRVCIIEHGDTVMVTTVVNSWNGLLESISNVVNPYMKGEYRITP